MSDYFQPEVLIEILSKLSVKSLLKFRCVCKSWCSLISSPDFINYHLNQTKINTYARKQLLIRYMSPNSLNEQYCLRFDDDDSFDGYDQFECPFEAMVYFRIVGICNGLICLSDDKFTYTYTLIIWNPAIRRYLSLPMPSVNFDSSGPYMFALGFGFDSPRNDYKVVRLAYLARYELEEGHDCYAAPKVEIYALSTCSWRTMESGVPPVRIAESVWTQAFLNGSVHWAAYMKEGNRLVNVILAFDMAEEKFRVIKFPQVHANGFPLNFTVGLHRESLAVFAYDNRVKCNCFEVYAMKEYGVAESWSRIYRVSGFEGGIGTVLGFREDGEMLLTTNANELVSYEPDCKRAKKLRFRGIKESVYAGAYAESLVLLKGVDGCLESQVKSYKNAVASIGAANQKKPVDERFVKDEIDLTYMYATDSIPGFEISDNVLMSSPLGIKAFMSTMATIACLMRR